MKTKRATAILALLLTVVTGPLVNAEAQPLTDTQIAVIRQNCSRAQQTLQQLQRSEAAVRVNRGRGYESALTLMASFNGRVALNKISAPKLADITSQVEDKFSAFRNDYIAYDDQLDTVIKLKCGEQPVTFYDELTRAREDRAKVAKDVQSIDSLLDQYQSAVTDLKASLTQKESAQ